MWGAITKDFGEFVSTVAADATETLESIDKTLDEPLVRGRGGGGDDENASSEALIDPDTGIILSSVVEEAKPDAVWKPPHEATPGEMKDLLVTREDVFGDPLLLAVGGVPKTAPSGEEIAPAETEPETEPEAEAETKGEAEPDSSSDETTEADAVAAFLEDFDVASKTEEISELLKADAALQTTFSMVSDTVSYKEFWTRYYYRIDDDDRLPQTYSVYYQRHEAEVELEAAAEAAEETPKGTMGGLSSFFGGVVNRLTDDGAETGTDVDTSGMADESLDRTMDSEDTGPGAVSAARSALGFLSTVAGGPLMNTTVDTEDEAEGEDAFNQTADDDEEESEVELGWDDDDDSQDDSQDEDGDEPVAFRDGDDRSETVDFKDAEKEQLQEQLEQARAERDALQKTVAMQTEELKKQQQQQQQASAGRSTTTTTATPPVEEASGDASTEQLKLQLFEKDAELAALRSKLEDDADAGTASPEATDGDEVRRLKELLAEKDRESSRREKEADELRATAEASSSSSDGEIRRLTQKLAETKSESSRREKESDELREALAKSDDQLAELRAAAGELEAASDPRTEARKEVDALRNDLEDTRSELGTARSDLEETRSELDRAATSKSELQKELDAMRNDLEATRSELGTARSELDRAKNAAAQDLAALRSELDRAKNAAADDLAALRSELDRVKNTAAQDLAALRSELDRAETASPSSSSTGVRVDAVVDTAASVPDRPTTEPAAAVVEPDKNSGDDDDDEDGWGDDW